MNDQCIVEDYVANTPGNVASILGDIMQPVPERYRVDTRRILHRTFLKPTVELFNIPFVVREEGGHTHLESERWPTISAFGDNFQEAVANLNALLKDLVVEYVLVSEDKLAEDAIELRNYLIGRIF